LINHLAKPLDSATVSATIYDLSGHIEQARTNQLGAGPNACTDVTTLNWPATGCHLVKLELRDQAGKLMSENFYWHARDEKQLQELNSLPKVKLDGKLREAHGAVSGRVTNSGNAPALAVRLTLRDAKTGKPVLSAYYDSNFFSLLPGESKEFHIGYGAAVDQPQVDLTGWNIEPGSLVW
jgi:hypothetical protein